MKLVTYESGKQLRLGVVEGEYVTDVGVALATFAKGRVANPKVSAAAQTLRKARPPEDMIDLLGRGEKYRRALGVVVSELAKTVSAKKPPKGLRAFGG